MLPSPQFPQLQFAADGAVLLHANTAAVTAWDVATWRPRYTCAGRLIGVSQSSHSVVTETGADTYNLWNSATGVPQTPNPTIAADLPFEVRYRVHLEKVQSGSYQGQWVDITGQQPPASIQVQSAGLAQVENLDNWIVISAAGWLACAWSWAEEDFDGAYGRYHALAGDVPDRVSLTVSRFHALPPFYFSRQHDWLITGAQNGFNVYTASTGQPYGGQNGKYSLPDGGGDVVAFHPHQRMWLAVNLTPTLLKDAAQQSFCLLDIQAGTAQPTVRQCFRENAPVVALAFHPHGNRVADLLNNGEIHLWQTDTGQMIARLQME